MHRVPSMMALMLAAPVCLSTKAPRQPLTTWAQQPKARARLFMDMLARDMMTLLSTSCALR